MFFRANLEIFGLGEIKDSSRTSLLGIFVTLKLDFK